MNKNREERITPGGRPRHWDDMCLEMIGTPLRIVACATRLGVRVTAQAAGVALGVITRLIDAASTSETTSNRPSAQHAPGAARGPEARTQPTTAHAPAAEAPSRTSIAPSSAVPAASPRDPSAPRHVSEGLQFVQAFAEPGAEEGAGAEVHVREPWNGYARMSAHAVIARLAEAGRAEIAAVMLYERVHRRRQTVLAAAQRQLRRGTARRPSQATGVDGARQPGVTSGETPPAAT